MQESRHEMNKRSKSPNLTTRLHVRSRHVESASWAKTTPDTTASQNHRRTRNRYASYSEPNFSDKYASSRRTTMRYNVHRTSGRRRIGHAEFTRTPPPVCTKLNAPYIGLRDREYGPVVTRRDAGRLGTMAVRARRKVTTPQLPSARPATMRSQPTKSVAFPP